MNKEFNIGSNWIISVEENDRDSDDIFISYNNWEYSGSLACAENEGVIDDEKKVPQWVIAKAHEIAARPDVNY